MNFKDFILKNKKYFIILGVGIILLLVGSIPQKNEVKGEENITFVDEKKLENTLEQIAGAGRVHVFISYENNGKKQIAQNISSSERGVEQSPESVKDDFYVLSTDTPEIKGVLITATGAENEVVKERILNGAKHALGVPYHRITVEYGK